jgi:chlorobactene lauroyltransferase
LASDTSFIPARESRWFIALFDLYVRNLFRRRFKNIAIDQHYQPSASSRTIYYLNHTSWWDGLIPLLLNRKLFRQNARAIMEDKQMRKHRFFSRIGAFSVNLDDPRTSMKSLRYAVESMRREQASLFIYPEGRILPYSIKKPVFKQGLSWITGQLQGIDVVPVGIYIHTIRSDKPELHIRIGKPVQADPSLSSDVVTEIYEEKLGELLSTLQRDASERPQLFKTL